MDRLRPPDRRIGARTGVSSARFAGQCKPNIEQLHDLAVEGAIEQRLEPRVLPGSILAGRLPHAGRWCPQPAPGSAPGRRPSHRPTTCANRPESPEILRPSLNDHRADGGRDRRRDEHHDQRQADDLRQPRERDRRRKVLLSRKAPRSGSPRLASAKPVTSGSAPGRGPFRCDPDFPRCHPAAARRERRVFGAVAVRPSSQNLRAWQELGTPDCVASSGAEPPRASRPSTAKSTSRTSLAIQHNRRNGSLDASHAGTPIATLRVRERRGVITMTRLFIGGHRELRRPMNVVDESLMKRIEDARRRLRLEGKDVKPLRDSLHSERPNAPRGSDRRISQSSGGAPGD